MERTEEQILFQDPLKVILGGKEYSLPPLTIAEARVWRKKLVEALNSITQRSSETSDRFSTLLIEVPEMTSDLFFAYAKTLKREEVEANATEGELVIAFEQVVDYARPLALTKGLTTAIPRALQ